MPAPAVVQHSTSGFSARAASVASGCIPPGLILTARRVSSTPSYCNPVSARSLDVTVWMEVCGWLQRPSFGIPVSVFQPKAELPHAPCRLERSAFLSSRARLDRGPPQIHLHSSQSLYISNKGQMWVYTSLKTGILFCQTIQGTQEQKKLGWASQDDELDLLLAWWVTLTAAEGSRSQLDPWVKVEESLPPQGDGTAVERNLASNGPV